MTFKHLAPVNYGDGTPGDHCVFHKHKEPAVRWASREPPSTSCEGGKMLHVNRRSESTVKDPLSALHFP
jgi:hypothetical protein